jgi:ketosteroid isomerase-like protein
MRLKTLLVVVLLISFRMAAQSDQSAADKSHIVINLENAWNQAESAQDIAALSLLLAPTFVYTDYDGSFSDRDKWLRQVQTTEKEYRGLVNVQQTAQVYGDTVVVTGIYVERLTMKGKNIDRHARFTDTWISRNGRWECVASQSTLTAP